MALQNQSKSQLIKNSGEMLCAVERAQRQAVSSFALHSVPADFQSEVVPAYNSSAFTIDDFSRCRNQSDPIYSQPLIVDGLKWRLKVSHFSFIYFYFNDLSNSLKLNLLY